jgi:cysteine-rich repeat protein
MTLKKFCFGLAFIILAASACSESSEKSDGDAGDDEDAATSPDGGVPDDEGGTEGPDGGEAPDSDGGGTPGGICGNGVVEGVEECDDGNFDQRDGCTTLCVFSCTQDSDCDDMNPCNGEEVCDEDTHACDDSDEGLEEGASCGENKSCWKGVCVDNICGDGKLTEGEECDDGNLDPDDGCTPECEYTCEDNSDCSGKDECLGDRVCEDHKCVGGNALEDETPCEIKDPRTKSLCGDPDVEKDGWCMNGVCTCTDCGDGVVSGIEECDDGLLNGTPQSPNNCSVNCRVVACQNGSVEGDEQCDDGNDQRLDGCDTECKFEFAHRFTSMEILKSVDVPDWCAHPDNRFAEAFAEEVMIMGVLPFNILRIVNQQLSLQMARGQNAYVMHVMDSDDISMKTADDDITLGFYQGSPAVAMEDQVDLPFVIQASQIDTETRLPAEYHSVQAEQRGGGRIFSKEPSTLEMISVTGDTYLMRDYMMQLVFDMDTLSTPNAEPLIYRDTIKVSEDLKVPEVSGEDPKGLFCGAMESGATDQPIIDMDFNTMTSGRGGYGPMASFCCKNTGPDAGTKYRACPAEGDYELGEDCDSIALLIQQGCTVCIDITDMSNLTAILDMGSNCDLMEENPDQCFKIINGIEFDIDTDGDEKNDTWSALFGFSALRTRIYDVSFRD